MILVTGGAGFIGSALIWALNEQGIDRIVVSDHLGLGDKWKNLAKRNIDLVVPKDQLFEWLEESGHPKFDAVFHLGACSATTERDADYLMNNNVLYTKRLWDYCAQRDIPFLYASSAATYGAREQNFIDQHQLTAELRPINKYGWSKQLFDAWALKQSYTPPYWYGFKYFNVYGPQEYHKGPQASVVYHAFTQVRDRSCIRLFKSYRPEIADGEQRRDFIYVKDVVKVMLHFWQEHRRIASGLYNLGTGAARSFRELGQAVFDAAEQKAKFEWIEMPDSLKGQYQYFTEADLHKLRSNAHYHQTFYSLEDGVADYISQYLQGSDPFL